MISESSRHVRGEAPVDSPASHPLMDETISLTREFGPSVLERRDKLVRRPPFR